MDENNNTDNDVVNVHDGDVRNIFREEAELFEFTHDLDFNNLNNEQQDELNEQLDPDLYNIYIYDADIDPLVLKEYNVRDYLYQPTDIYTTGLLTDPEKNTRYLIISKDFRQIPDDELTEQYRNIKLALSGVLNCFKIVDITKKGDTTQITLLHLNVFEKLAIEDHKTDIEQKAVEMGKELINTEEYTYVDIDLEDINYKIRTAIGINNRESGLKPFTRDQMVFYLRVLAAIYEKYNSETVFEFTDKYDMANIINIYQNSVSELKGMHMENNEQYRDEKEQIITAYIKTILNSLEVAMNFNKPADEVSYDLEKKSNEELVEEISKILGYFRG